MQRFLRIGKIISLHGIKGEVKVYNYSDDIHRFDDLKTFYLDKDPDAPDDKIDTLKIYKVISVKYIKNTVILALDGYDSIEKSTSLVGDNLYIDRKDAIKLSENEYFISDLIGLQVFEDGVYIGKVKDVLTNPANDILSVDYQNKDILIPMVPLYLQDIDIKSKVINVKNFKSLL